MESSLQRGMRWQFITSYMHRYIEYDTTMLCFINWFHRIRYTTTVFFCWCNCQSCRISSTPSNYEVYRASNLKFHVSIANLKKKRVFTPLTKAAGEISSAKSQGSSALLSKTFMMPPAAAPFLSASHLTLSFLSFSFVQQELQCCASASESARYSCSFTSSEHSACRSRIQLSSLNFVFWRAPKTRSLTYAHPHA